MSKILLVDSNFSSLPLYRALEKYATEIHVVGANSNDCLAKLSKHFHHIDYSDVKKISQLIKSNDYDYIVPGSTDRSYTSCSLVNTGRYFGIDTPQNEEIINNKFKFKEHAISIGLTVPPLYHIDHILDYPIIVKPVDSFSGKGITVINKESRDNLNDAIATACMASKTGNYFIEKFVSGTLHSYSAFYENGNIKCDFLVEEFCSKSPFAVDISRIKPHKGVDVINKLRVEIENLCNSLSLSNGLIHTQFILTNSNEAFIIEITRRCPGDLYSLLIEYSTGVDYADLYVRPFLGLEIPKVNKKLKKFIIRHTITQKIESTFASLTFKPELNIKNYISLATIGDTIKVAPLSRVGILFAECKSNNESDKLIQNALANQIAKINSKI